MAFLERCPEKSIAILRLASDGKTNQEISKKLDQSERAVGIVVGNFMSAIGASRREKAVEFLPALFKRIDGESVVNGQSVASPDGSDEVSGPDSEADPVARSDGVSDDAGKDSKEASLGERTRAFLKARDMKPKELAQMTYLSVPTIYNVMNDKRVSPGAAQVVELTMLVQGFEQKDDPVKSLDPTLRDLAKRVCVAADNVGELDELTRLIFLRWKKVKGDEKAKHFTLGILCRYVAVEDPNNRLDALLELHDEVKNFVKKD